MGVLGLLKEAKEAFHEMEWGRLAKITKEITDLTPDEPVKGLASGFYFYASAKLAKEPENVILALDKASSFFKGVDAHLASLADIERLILLAGFDKKNEGLHLRELGELTQGLFIKTGDVANLQLAIESFNRAKEHFRGKELAQIVLDLQFCHGSNAGQCDNPLEAFGEVIKLKGEVKTKEKAIIACSNMNVAIAYHNLAFLKGEPASIKEAIKLTQEAISTFEAIGQKPEIVRAKQTLANILMDGAALDAKNTKKHMEGAILLKKEVVDIFLSDGFDIDAAYEDMSIGVAYFEFATCDSASCDGHFKNAINHFNAACEIFEKEEVPEGLAPAKAGIAAVHKNQENLEEAARIYEEALEIFSEPIFTGHTKQNLAEVYHEMAKATGNKDHESRAKKLKKEAKKLLSAKS
ncbi:tetratricopeptide repeat protein [archaeon]|nr:tetratricopeptide repeat protein [archaeon]